MLNAAFPLLEIKAGHLPFLYHSQTAAKPSVPNDVSLNFIEVLETRAGDSEQHPCEDGNFNIVTGGPNEGKTVMLQMTANMVLAAHIGADVLGEMAFTPGPILTFVKKRESLKLGEGAFISVLRRLDEALADVKEKKGSYLFLNEQVAGVVERRIGHTVEKSFARELCRNGALVIHVTHDLGVTALGEEPGFRNIHFRRDGGHKAYAGPATPADYDLAAIMEDANVSPDMRALILEALESDSAG